MIHSDATEKPVARARGGIANDKAVRMPGATTASSAEIAQLSTTATTRFGDSANNAEQAAAASAAHETNRIRPAKSAAYRLVAILAPTTRPTSWNGSAIAAAMPRARSSRSNSCSYSSAARATNPTRLTARKGSDAHSRRSVGIRCTVRQLSANDGGGLLGHHDVGGRAHRLPLPAPAHRFAEPEGEEGEHERRSDEHHERQPPPELEGEQPGHQRPDERADGVGGAMGAVHAAARRQRVVVGEQRVVRRVDDGLADGRSRAGDAEHPERRREPGEAGEQRPAHRAADHQREPRPAVGELGDRHLQREGRDRHGRDERQRGRRGRGRTSSRISGSRIPNAVRSSSSTALSPNRITSG